MSNDVFSPIEIDTLSEIINISFGFSAKIVSEILNSDITISQPEVTVDDLEHTLIADDGSVVSVEITHTSDLIGSNIMLFNINDVKAIVNILAGNDIHTPISLNENEINVFSAFIYEMMGASSQALSEYLGKDIKVLSTDCNIVSDSAAFKERVFGQKQLIANIAINLDIKGQIKTAMQYVIPFSFAKAMVAQFEEGTIDADTALQEAQAIQSAEHGKEETIMNNAPTNSAAINNAPQIPVDTKIQVETQASNQVQEHQINSIQQQVDTRNANIHNMQQYGNTNNEAYVGSRIEHSSNVTANPVNVSNVVHRRLEESKTSLNVEQSSNLELIMSVPLEVSVEIGRTRKKVKDILELTKGSLIVLDKLAGENVDVFVNGQCIAKGDVVVIDDCFGVRITEIVKKLEI